MSIFATILSKLIPVGKIIDDLHTSGEEKLAAQIAFQKIQLEIEKSVLDYETEVVRAQAKVLVTEMSGNWWQRSWRPILMLSIIGILVNNYILLPYIPGVVPLDLPDSFLIILSTAVPGYIGGRSYEKGLKIKAANGHSKSPGASE